MEKLAIKGGYPVRGSKIYYGRQCIEEDDIQAVVETLRSDFITCGPKVDEFESELCKFTGAKYAVAVSNGTAALHVACMAAGIGPGDEVITTPITFAASANCALYCGATPVFADIDPETYNIDPQSVRERITPKTKAVIAVDFTGQVVQVDEIRKICNENDLIFIEDAAHSIASTYNGRQVGSLADLTTFSFHPVKTITGGEGGAITTNDEKLYKRLLLYRTHGITKHSEEMMQKSGEDGDWYYEMQELGYNYRITDFQAALLVSQMKKLPRFSAARKAIVKKYNEAFAKVPEIIVQKEIPQSDTTRHLYIIQLKLDRLTCTRKEFFDALAAEGVQPQVHYIPVYWFPYYEKRGYKKGLCPNSEKLYGAIMSLPLYPSLTNRETDDVIHAVKKVVANYKKKERDVEYVNSIL